MDAIIIQGKNSLNGEVRISGSKNATLPIMAACLLTADEVILKNIPDLSDVNTMCSLLTSHGASINRSKSSIKLQASDVKDFTAHYEIVKKMRASIWVLGPLLSRFGEAKVSLPGGCAIGARKVDLHLEALQALGADIKTENGYIIARRKNRLQGANFHFTKVSVGATINTIMAATLAKGITRLTNCAKEPEIVDLCNFLIKMGASIKGVGTDILEISGVNKLNGAQHSIIPDRIEAGTYMIAAAITSGKISVYGAIANHLDSLIFKLRSSGVKVDINEDKIEVDARGIKLKASDIHTAPYPGFHTDLQAQFMSLMTLATGTSVITENIFENRYMHVPELIRMGANIDIDGKRAIVRGVKNLYGAEVMASDLRASVSLVLAGLAAEGQTIVHRVYHLYRGYENLVQKLQKCGAKISVINSSVV